MKVRKKVELAASYAKEGKGAATIILLYCAGFDEHPTASPDVPTSAGV
ncbi:hypothetical protein [Alicyclobacillus sendaiensis]|nr:hypothetical protein [Alicyclobacillus sendaiensis]